MSMMEQRADFVTDTATMCVFDLAALKHRLQDDADWWSIPRDEVAEVNAGNVAFVGLGADGQYSVESGVIESAGSVVRCRLKAPSGRLFVGAGEEVTSDGLEPEGIRGGMFVDVQPGVYELTVARIDRRLVRIQLVEQTGPATNAFVQPLRL